MGKRNGTELSTITSSELSSVIYSPLGETIKNPFSREIFLLGVRVAGLRYRDNIDELLKNLKVGDKVIFVREPENEYDDFAIMILNEDKVKLGYVPRVNNEIPVRLMDAGMKLSGKVSRIKEPEEDIYPWDALYVDIFLDENSNALLPEFGKQQEGQDNGFPSKISGFLHTTFSSEMNRPFSREIFLANFPAMESHRIQNLQRVLCKMKVGDRVLLRREPDNEKNDMAIIVLNKRKRRLGYIPRSHSTILARLMDAGKHIYGIAYKIDNEKNGVWSRNMIVIDVYMEV
ncbi:MAG: HIRAN domain-containing protein [Lachnospiraceae bacterium]|nr:HIRAN domain-containing protein [Lachnospiraceae bacterium]